MELETINQEQLSYVKMRLDQAMDDLNVSVDERPMFDLNKVEAAAKAAQINFDPYKSQIVRQAEQVLLSSCVFCSLHLSSMIMIAIKVD